MTNTCWRAILIGAFLACIVWPIMMRSTLGEVIDARQTSASVLIALAIFFLGWKSVALLGSGDSIGRVLLWLSPPALLAILVVKECLGIEGESVILYFIAALLSATSSPIRERIVPGSNREWWELLAVVLVFALLTGIGWLLMRVAASMIQNIILG